MPGKKVTFDWDEANTLHIAKHDVTPAEVEEVIRGTSLLVETEERSGEDRHVQLGQTSVGRLLIVVWTSRRQKIRVVTAFPANRKWQAHWRRVYGAQNA